MKKKVILFITALMIIDAPRIVGQDCIFYENGNYEGDTYYLSIEQSIEVFLRDTIIRRDNTNPSMYETLYFPNFPSWQIRENSGAAIQIESLTPYGNYPFILLNSAESAKGIGGGDADNYANQVVKVSCKSADELPQPKMFLPLNRYDSNFISEPRPMPGPDSNVLVLKKAFLWGNSEDIGCCHGPTGAVSIRAYPPSTFSIYNNDPNLISANYCEGTITNCIGCCTRFNEFLIDFRMPGPVLTFDNPCDDFDPFDPDYYACGGLADDLFNLFDFFNLGIPGSVCEAVGGGDCGEWFTNNPGSEWIDGPWGVCYSNFPVFNWDAHKGVDSIFVMLREGDVTNNDDYMGGGIISKDMEGPILLRTWYFGWIELENIKVPALGREPSVTDCDYYWFNDWNGVYPDGNGVITTQYSQYLPLANTSISEMETIFGEDKAIGLLGKKFPGGILSTPMTYKACCEPATFSPDYDRIDFTNLTPQSTSFNIDKSVINPQNNFDIYPNPSTGNIQLAHYFQEITPANIYLLNAVGQRVKTLLSNETIPQGEFSQSFALGGLPAGIYYCVLETQKERKVQKLVLSK